MATSRTGQGAELVQAVLARSRRRRLRHVVLLAPERAVQPARSGAPGRPRTDQPGPAASPRFMPPGRARPFPISGSRRPRTQTWPWTAPPEHRPTPRVKKQPAQTSGTSASAPVSCSLGSRTRGGTFHRGDVSTVAHYFASDVHLRIRSTRSRPPLPRLAGPT